MCCNWIIRAVLHAHHALFITDLTRTHITCRGRERPDGKVVAHGLERCTEFEMFGSIKLAVGVVTR